MHSVPIIYRTIFATFFFFCATIFFMGRVSRKRPSDVYLMSFLFSLASVATVVIATWAYTVGAIDEHGAYQGRTGEVISQLLHFSLGLSEEITLVSTSLLLLTLPQLMAYIISGFFGSAFRPLFIETGLKCGFWFVVKSFPTISGIVLGLILTGGFLKWPDYDAVGISRGIFLSTMLMFGCYFAIDIYTEFQALPDNLPLPLRNLIHRLHRHFTRRSSSSEMPGQSLNLIESARRFRKLTDSPTVSVKPREG